MDVCIVNESFNACCIEFEKMYYIHYIIHYIIYIYYVKDEIGTVIWKQWKWISFEHNQWVIFLKSQFNIIGTYFVVGNQIFNRYMI